VREGEVGSSLLLKTLLLHDHVGLYPVYRSIPKIRVGLSFRDHDIEILIQSGSLNPPI
jgi:hypothetical protein